MSKIDTEIKHVTKPGANLFAELGFSNQDADRYHQDSRKQIEALLALKQQLMSELAVWIKDNGMRQEDAARLLHVSRPRVSDVVNKKTEKFTMDALVSMLTRIGRPVKLVVG